MSMNILVSLWLMAALVHRGVTTGSVVIPSDSVLSRQVCVDENDFCWFSCLFVNQYKI